MIKKIITTYKTQKKQTLKLPIRNKFIIFSDKANEDDNIVVARPMCVVMPMNDIHNDIHFYLSSIEENKKKLI